MSGLACWAREDSDHYAELRLDGWYPSSMWRYHFDLGWMVLMVKESAP